MAAGLAAVIVELLNSGVELTAGAAATLDLEPSTDDEDDATVTKVEAEDTAAAGAAAELAMGNDPAPQRHWQSHTPAPLIVPVPEAIPLGDPTAGVAI